MQDSEKTLDKISKDIEIYKLLRFYTSCLKEDNLSVAEKTKDTIDFLVKRINFNISELYSIIYSTGEDFKPILFKKITSALPLLSARTRNAFKGSKIIYIGDLITSSKSDLLKIENFGRKSLNEIEYELRQFDLRLDMYIPKWRPVDFEELVKRYNNYM